VRATYPFVRITTSTHERLDSRLSYGFVAGPGASTRIEFISLTPGHAGPHIDNVRLYLVDGHTPAKLDR